MFLHTIVFCFVQRKGKECPNAADEMVTILSGQVIGASRILESRRICVTHVRESDCWDSKPGRTGCASKIAETKVSQAKLCSLCRCSISKAISSDRTLRCIRKSGRPQYDQIVVTRTNLIDMV